MAWIGFDNMGKTHNAAKLLNELAITIRQVGVHDLDYNPINVHILIDFGAHTLYDTAFPWEKDLEGDKQNQDKEYLESLKGEMTKTFNLISKAWELADGNIPSHIQSKTPSPELERWMQTNLTIVRADKKADENTTRRMFLHGDTANDREFFWPYPSFQELPPRYVLTGVVQKIS